MKVRWNRESVRLRITPTEMAMILRGEEFGEELGFPGGTTWRVTVSAGTQTALASEENTANVTLSAEDRERLAAPDAEGVYFQAGGLRYYIEKDFPCVHKRGAEALEPGTETFIPPAGFEARKLETETEINGE